MKDDVLEFTNGLDETKKYLSFLFGEVDSSDLILLCRIRSDEEIEKTKMHNRMEIKPFYNTKIKDVAAFLSAKNYADVPNFYCQIGVTKKELVRGSSRSKETEVTCLPAFYVDLDYAGASAHKKKSLPPDKASVLDMIDRAFIKPSIIVHSGNGIHAYWVLDKPVRIGQGYNLEAVKSINKAIHDLFAMESKKRSWTIDSVFDLTRILRVPGTINLKSIKGQPSIRKMCTIEDFGGARYSIEHIVREIQERNLQYAPEIQTHIVTAKQKALMAYAPKGTVISVDLTNKHESVSASSLVIDNTKIILNPKAFVSVSDIDDLIAVNPNIIQIIKGMWDKQKFPSTSECDYEIIKTALECLWDYQKIVDILIHYRTTNQLDIKKVMRPSYIETSIRNAQVSIRNRVIMNDAKNFQVLSTSEEDGFVSQSVVGKNKQAISELLGVDILKLIKHTGDDPSYTMSTALGDVKFEKIDFITSKTKFRNKLAAAINKVVELPKDWLAVSNLILSIVENDVNDESSRSKEIVRSFLDEYFLEAMVRTIQFNSHTDSSVDQKILMAANGISQIINKSLGDRNAYFMGKDYTVLYFFLDNFYTWMKDYRKSEFKISELRTILKSFKTCKETKTDHGIIEKTVWMYKQTNETIISRVKTALFAENICGGSVNNTIDGARMSELSKSLTGNSLITGIVQ